MLKNAKVLPIAGSCGKMSFSCVYDDLYGKAFPQDVQQSHEYKVNVYF